MIAKRLEIRPHSGFGETANRRGAKLLAALVALMMISVGMLTGTPSAVAAAKASVTIRITTTNGDPAPGLYVALGNNVKKTKADGTARFKGIAKGHRNVVVSEAKGFVTTGWQFSAKVRLTSGKNGTKTLRAKNLTVIRGKVTRNGKAVKKAAVRVTDLSSGMTRSSVSAKGGTYAISLGKPRRTTSKVQVSVTKGKGRITYAPGTLRSTEASSYEVSWTKARTVNVKLQNGPKGWITGTVVQANGQAAVGASVHLSAGSHLSSPQPFEYMQTRTVGTDVNGRYRIGNLAPGKYRLYAEDGAGQSAGRSSNQVVTVKAKKAVAKDLSFRKTGVVTVPVTSGGKQAFEIVGLIDETGDLVGSNHFYGDGPGWSSFTTFSYVPEGTYRATIIGTNMLTAPVRLLGGSTATTGQLVVPQATAGSGKVSLPDGQGVVADLTFRDSNGLDTLYPYESSKNGRFSIARLYSGSNQLYVKAASPVTVGSRKVQLVQRYPVNFVVTTGTPVTDLLVPLEVGGTASGHVVRPNSKKPLTDVQVTASRVTSTGIAELDTATAYLNKKGKYTFDNLVPGIEYRISFSDVDAVYRTTWYGAKKGKKSAAKSTVVTVNAKKTKKLGTIAMLG